MTKKQKQKRSSETNQIKQFELNANAFAVWKHWLLTSCSQVAKCLTIRNKHDLSHLFIVSFFFYAHFSRWTMCTCNLLRGHWMRALEHRTAKNVWAKEHNAAHAIHEIHSGIKTMVTNNKFSFQRQRFYNWIQYDLRFVIQI